MSNLDFVLIVALIVICAMANVIVTSVDCDIILSRIAVLEKAEASK